MTKSILSRSKDAARKKINRLLSTYPYVETEAEIKPVVVGDTVRLEYQFITMDAKKQEDLRQLFAKREIVPASDVPVVLEPLVEEVKAVVEEVKAESTKTYRRGSKREKIRQMIAAGTAFAVILGEIGWREDVAWAACREVAKECGLEF